jgi:transcriptional regulator NrdR family protein
MICPVCNSEKTRVLESRQKRRRRECSHCRHRWTTIEVEERRYVAALDAAAKVIELADALKG